MRIQLMPLLDLNSDEWHADETVVKIAGVKHYIWFVVDSETRFIVGLHLSPYRNSSQAVSVLHEARKQGNPAPLSLIGTVLIKCLLNQYLTKWNTFGLKALKMIFPITLLNAFTSSLRPGTTPNRGFRLFLRDWQKFCVNKINNLP